MADATPACARGMPETAALVIGGVHETEADPEDDVGHEKPGERGDRIDPGEHRTHGRQAYPRR